MEKNNEVRKYEDAKSVHVFAWPFLVSEEEEKLSDKLGKKGWIREQIDYREGQGVKAKTHYMLEQYLSSDARQIFKGAENTVCELYKYPLEQPATYHIELKKATYDLEIEEIELHIYKFGVGILFIKTLNTTATGVGDMILINNKGRDIRIPFLPDAKDEYIACAEKLGIIYGQDSYITDFREKIVNYYGKKENAAQEVSKPAQFLQDVLNVRLGKKGVSAQEEEIKVRATTDDRMYVMSIIRDEQLSKRIKQENWSDDDEKELYQIIFVDDDSGATCQNKAMRKDFLEKNVYARWKDEGTVFGITEYAFHCLTSDDKGINAFVIRPMYAEYLYMFSLVIAQRLAILRFSEEAGELAGRTGKKDGLVCSSISKKLIALQENYIVFLNRMMISEFSCQQQGIEMYDMMEDLMMVNKERDLLDAQLQGLFEIVNTSNGTKNNRWTMALTVIATIAAIIQIWEPAIKPLWEIIKNAFNCTP